MSDQPSKPFVSGEVSARYVLLLVLGMGGWSHTSDSRLAERVAVLESTTNGVHREIDDLRARVNAKERTP